MLGQQVISKNSSQKIQSLDLCRPRLLTVASDLKGKRSSLVEKVVSRIKAAVFRLAIFIREDSARADQAEKFLNEAKTRAHSCRHRIY